MFNRNKIKLLEVQLEMVASRKEEWYHMCMDMIRILEKFKTISGPVKTCSTCPFGGVHQENQIIADYFYCKHPVVRNFGGKKITHSSLGEYHGQPPPAFCPLRTKPLIVE